MNEQSIQKQYNQIVSLLEDKRLKEALVQLDAFLYNSNDWTLRNRLEQIQTSYQYMLQYMKLGMKDPERHKLYRQLLADTGLGIYAVPDLSFPASCIAAYTDKKSGFVPGGYAKSSHYYYIRKHPAERELLSAVYLPVN